MTVATQDLTTRRARVLADDLRRWEVEYEGEVKESVLREIVHDLILLVD